MNAHLNISLHSLINLTSTLRAEFLTVDMWRKIDEKKIVKPKNEVINIKKSLKDRKQTNSCERHEKWWGAELIIWK